MLQSLDARGKGIYNENFGIGTRNTFDGVESGLKYAAPFNGNGGNDLVRISLDDNDTLGSTRDGDLNNSMMFKKNFNNPMFESMDTKD